MGLTPEQQIEIQKIVAETWEEIKSTPLVTPQNLSVGMQLSTLEKISDWIGGVVIVSFGCLTLVFLISIIIDCVKWGWVR